MLIRQDQFVEEFTRPHNKYTGTIISHMNSLMPVITYTYHVSKILPNQHHLHIHIILDYTNNNNLNNNK